MIKHLEEIKKMDLECGTFSVYNMDGKTTQEIFNQFFTKINDVVDATNASTELIEYLAEKGIKEEITKKVLELIADGTIDGAVGEDVLLELNKEIEKVLENIKEQKDEIDALKYMIDELSGNIVDVEGHNVKYYGAKGDGVTDDTEAFKKAIFATKYSNNKTVKVPSGTYLISDNLEITDSLTLKGDTNSVIKFNVDNIRLKIDGASNVTIKDVTIDGNNKMHLNAIRTENLANNVLIENVTFRNFVSPIGTKIIEMKSTLMITIRNCVFENFVGRTGYAVYGGSYVASAIIENNTFHDCNLTSSQLILFIEDSTNAYRNKTIIIRNNIFVNVDVDRCIKTSRDNVRIKDNTFNIENNTKLCYAIEVSKAKDVIITDNSYNLKNTEAFSRVYNIIEDADVIIKSDTIFITETSAYAKKPVVVVKGSSAVISNMNMSGSTRALTSIYVEKAKKIKIHNLNADFNSMIVHFIQVLGCDSLELSDNNVYLQEGSTLLNASYKDNTIKEIKVLNNKFFYENVDIVNLEAIRISDFENAIIENNNFKNKIYVENFKKLTLRNNELLCLDVNSTDYDILSENNTFKGEGIAVACYNITCNNAGNRNYLISRNNYNEMGLTSLIYFKADSYYYRMIDVKIETINDVFRNTIGNSFIKHSENVTKDIYTKCFVQTSQEHAGFTWYSKDYPLYNYKKPHGAVIYNADTGKSTLYVRHQGQEKVTQL